MRIGMLGGTFDPIHNGHLFIAKKAAEAFELDRVLLMVAADPPHKHHQGMLLGKDRFALAQTAAEPYGGLVEASDMELQRGGKSFSVDTLSLLSQAHPQAQCYMIVGGDMLVTLPTWHDAQRLFQVSAFIGVPRPGTDVDYTAIIRQLRRGHGARVELAPFEGPPLSSTDIRLRIRNAQPIETMVPCGVERMIYERGFYFPDSFTNMQEKIRSMQNEKRYRHTMGTVRTAIALADRYGEDGERARLAALLHDCAKVDGRDIFEQAAQVGVPAEDRRYRGLMHAPVGAVYASSIFGVTDPAVIDAIRYHTTGRPGMTRLEKIVYLADVIEPNRDFEGVDRLRQAACRGLDYGVTEALKESVRDVQQRGRRLHPRTAAALEWMTTR